MVVSVLSCAQYGGRAWALRRRTCLSTARLRSRNGGVLEQPRRGSNVSGGMLFSPALLSCLSRNAPMTNASPGSNDALVSTTAKLTTSALLGGALIKYGSLCVDVPFQPNAVLALAIVSAPPLGFAIWMLLQDSDDSSS